MRMKQVQVFNYKRFVDSGPLSVGPLFNVITGRNNSGKSALLEAIRPGFQNSPPRTLSTQPVRGATITSRSETHVWISATRAELHNWLRLRKGAQFRIPTGRTDWSAALAELIQKDHLAFAVRLINAGIEPLKFDNRDDYSPHQSMRFVQMRIDDTGKPQFNQYLDTTPSSEDLSVLLAQELFSQTFRFRAERMNVGQFQVGPSTVLADNAQNLSQVLYALQANHHRFDRYNALVRQVLPEIARVSVHPINSNIVETRVWTISHETERDDLAFRLEESGTGVAQVLAMMAVLIIAEHPQIFLIDEPGSFLHPGAVRNLFEVFRQHSQHQYIVTTHSPEVIGATSDGMLSRIIEGEDGARILPVSRVDRDQLRDVLREVGTRLSDVFGADRILWVEGATEEICFPLICRALLPENALVGTSIVGVLNTGDFDSSDAEYVIRLYKRLCAGTALTPPAVAFLFDREIRSSESLASAGRESRGLIRFIPRRSFENFLLEPEAIAAVLAGLGVPVTKDRVAEWIEEHRDADSYWKGVKSKDYPHGIDASRLLADLFVALSDAKFEYSKTRDSVALTKWLIEHRPEVFADLRELLREILSPGV